LILVKGLFEVSLNLPKYRANQMRCRKVCTHVRNRQKRGRKTTSWSLGLYTVQSSIEEVIKPKSISIGQYTSGTVVPFNTKTESNNKNPADHCAWGVIWRERERLTMPLIWEMLDGDVVLTVLRGDATATPMDSS
jgi:hypothetical protein